MSLVALALGLWIAILGALALLSPQSFARILRRFTTTAGFYVGIGSRLLLGASLFLSAPDSNAPEALRLFGVIFVLAGLVMAGLGFGTFRSAGDWFLSLASGATRTWGVVAIGTGLLIAYAVTS